MSSYWLSDVGLCPRTHRSGDVIKPTRSNSAIGRGDRRDMAWRVAWTSCIRRRCPNNCRCTYRPTKGAITARQQCNMRSRSGRTRSKKNTGIELVKFCHDPVVERAHGRPIPTGFRIDEIESTVRGYTSMHWTDQATCPQIVVRKYVRRQKDTSTFDCCIDCRVS